MHLRRFVCLFLALFPAVIFIAPNYADARAEVHIGEEKKHTQPESAFPQPAPSVLWQKSPPVPGQQLLKKVAGGLLGAGIATKLFGDGYYGNNAIGLLPIFLLASLIYIVYRRPQKNSAPPKRPAAPPMAFAVSRIASADQLLQPLAITGLDKDSFAQALYDVQ